MVEPAAAEACALLSASTLAGAEVRPLLDVALERVTRAVFPFCVPAASVLAGLAVVTVLEGAVVVEALPVAVLLDGVAAVLREVLVVEVPVFTCLLAGVPLEAELLELVLLLRLLPLQRPFLLQVSVFRRLRLRLTHHPYSAS